MTRGGLRQLEGPRAQSRFARRDGRGRLSPHEYRSGDRLLAGRVLGGLFDCELAAGASDGILFGDGVDELKAVAEGASLANCRQNVDVAGGQGELEANDFPDRNLGAQHGGNAGFADIDGVAASQWAIAGIDADGDLERETAMAAWIHEVVCTSVVIWSAILQADGSRGYKFTASG